MGYKLSIEASVQPVFVNCMAVSAALLCVYRLHCWLRPPSFLQNSRMYIICLPAIVHCHVVTGGGKYWP